MRIHSCLIFSILDEVVVEQPKVKPEPEIKPCRHISPECNKVFEQKKNNTYENTFEITYQLYILIFR